MYTTHFQYHFLLRYLENYFVLLFNATNTRVFFFILFKIFFNFNYFLILICCVAVQSSLVDE